MSGEATVASAESSSTRQAQRRAILHWRLVTAAYLIALTTGTHWPQLSVGVGTGPPPDKILHLLAFGGLALLLWQCRITTRVWMTGVITAVWLLIDEWTQSLPMLRRQSSWMDVTSGLTGVMCAMLWIWATAPVGGRLARWRRGLFEQVLDERLSRIAGWFWLGCGAVAMAMTAALLGALWLIVLMAQPMPILIGDPFNTLLIAFFLGGVFGIHQVFNFWWHAHRERIASRRRCFGCGSACSPPSPGQDAPVRCSRCRLPIHPLQWTIGADLRWRHRTRGLITLTVLLGAAFIIYFLFVARGEQRFHGVVPVWDRPYPPLHAVADLSFFVVVACVGIRIERTFAAAVYDNQDKHCVRCAHDLNLLTTDQGLGRCPECGAPYVRIDSSDAPEDTAS